MFAYPVGQLDELADGKLLGARGEERMLGTAEITERGAEGVANHLAPLPERRLDDADEQPLVAIELRDAVAPQPDDSAFDLGRRVENRLADREEYSMSYHACKSTDRIPYSLDPGGSARRTATSF